MLATRKLINIARTRCAVNLTNWAAWVDWRDYRTIKKKACTMPATSWCSTTSTRTLPSDFCILKLKRVSAEIPVHLDTRASEVPICVYLNCIIYPWISIRTRRAWPSVPWRRGGSQPFSKGWLWPIFSRRPSGISVFCSPRAWSTESASSSRPGCIGRPTRRTFCGSSIKAPSRPWARSKFKYNRVLLYLSLLGVVRGGDAFKDFQLPEGGGALGGLVRNHTSHGSPEDLSRRSVMLDPSSGVMRRSLVQELVELHLVSEQRTGFVQRLATHHNNSLTVQKLLGYDGSQTTHQMPLSVYNHQLFKHI